MEGKFLLIVIASLCALLLPSLVMATTNDTVSVNVNVSEAAQIEVSPNTATFNLVIPGDVGFPNSQAFTITNVGSTNFTQMYVSMNVHETETTNPLGTGNPSNYYAGGFVVLKNETDLAGGNNWRFVGRQEWNLTDKPEPYTPSTWAKAWGYFGNNTYQYFWELANGSAGYCNDTGTILKIKQWAVNGTATAYDVGSDATTHQVDTEQEDWGVVDPVGTGPLANYCVATHVNCTRIYIYQWDQTSQLDSCTDEWNLYSGVFKPNDQFDFNITVWVPKGIPAGDTSSSTLTVTAS